MNNFFQKAVEFITKMNNSDYWDDTIDLSDDCYFEDDN